MQTRQEEQEHQNQKDQYYYSNFINSLKSKDTKTVYVKRVGYFMTFLGIKEGKYSRLVEGLDKKIIEDNIKSFLVYLRQERGGVSYRSASFYLDSIKKFYYVNSDYEFKWKLIKMYLGDDDDQNTDTTETAPIEEDRPYTRDEIHTMLKSANDTRTKIIILLIASSGMRVGAIPSLKLRNLVKNPELGIYQISVYEGSRKSNYKTFCTPECTAVIDAYLDYRKHAGETLKDISPLLREQFNPDDMFKVNNPRHIGLGLLRYLVNEVLVKYSALRQKLEYDYQNKKKVGKNSTMLTHGLRKFFDTECRKAGVYPDFVELLMGHKLPGVKSHYFKPDMNTLLEGTAECKGYKAAINDLTINEEFRLSKQVKELNEKNQYQNYVIDKKLKSMEDFILQMFDKYEKVDRIEHQKELKKLTETKGKYYAMFPNGEPLSESEKIQKEMNEDIHKQWFLLIKDRPDLQQKYGVKFVDRNSSK
ncbi:MAG: site-specific integrase [Nitrososphaeraceae archaeon]|nr:site-specific integrase [Nitrososphaeraceae archaeon]